jgi:hypothetical protein
VSKLLDALAKIGPSRSGRPCSVDALLASLPDDERKALESAMVDPARSKSTLSEAVKTAYGADISGQVLWRHAKGHCRCAS